MRRHRRCRVSQPGPFAGWLSPTRAWRIVECPASVRPLASGVATVQDEQVNVGTLTHRVLEHWIRAAGYRTADPQGALADAADACESKLHGSPPPGWRISRARLIARGLSLVDLIGNRPPEHVVSEIELQDDDLRLRGQVDLLLLGDEIVVVDLKTETMLDEGLTDWMRFQLTIYAHLVQKTYGRLPDSAEVFSLNRGRRKVHITEESVRDALTALVTARAADRTHADPSPATCHFCGRRLECAPHWDASSTWPVRDAVEGVVERAEYAAAGMTALLLKTADGPEWVSRIPGAAGQAAPGDSVRIVRLKRVAPSRNDQMRAWSWQRTSAIRVVHQPGSSADR